MQHQRTGRTWMVGTLLVVASLAIGVPTAAAAPTDDLTAVDDVTDDAPVADPPTTTTTTPTASSAPTGPVPAAPPRGEAPSPAPVSTPDVEGAAGAVEEGATPARLSVELDAVPNDAQDVTVQVCGSAGCSSAIVDDDAIAPRERVATFDPLDAGTYTVTIGAVPGWTLSAFACGPDDAVDLAQRSATVVLEPGEAGDCRFTITFSPSITVRQDTVPDGPQDVGFTICPAALDGSCSAPASAFVLDDDADPELGATFTHHLPAGLYAVTQEALPGWQLTGLTCSTAEVVDLARRRVVVQLGGAEATMCTFTDRQGAVVVQQDLVPDGPQDFTFDVCSQDGPCRTVVLDDDPGDTTRGPNATVDGLAPGTYTVTQVPVADQVLTDLSCNGGQTDVATGRATVVVAAGQTLTCRFTNRPTSLTVVVDATPNTGQDFAFTTCGDEGCHDVLLDDDSDAGRASRWTLGPTPAGTYRITQAEVPGWVLAGIVCDSGATVDVSARAATVELTPGKQVTCTFSEQTGSVGVSLDTAPAADPQDVTFGLCPVVGDCRTATLDTDADATRSNTAFFEGLAPGVWTLTQATVAGWAATSVSCNIGAVDLAGASVTVVVAAGAPVSCTFRVAQTTLTVVHDALPDDGADVAFTACRAADDCTGFSLDDDADPTLPNRWSLRGLVATTTNRVSRLTTAGWGPAAVSCTGGEVDPGGVAVVSLQPGQQVTCTFSSHATSLTIVHDTVPDGPQDFTYTGCAGVDGANGCGPFVLDDDGDPTQPSSVTFSGLDAGTLYGVTLQPVAGFGVSSLVCDRGEVDRVAGHVEVALRPGEQVRCTFVVRSTSLTIRQASSLDNAQDVGYVGCRTSAGPDACAPFVLDADSDPAVPGSVTSRGLEPGEYVVTQGEVAGFGLTGLTCSQGVVDRAARRATVELQPGDQVTCTFTVAATSVTIVQDTLPDGPQDVAYTGCAGAGGELGCGPFVLDDDNDVVLSRTATSRGLVAGRTYTVTQQRTAGFGLTAINCNRGVVDLGARRVTFVLEPGEQATCTFVLQATSLTIVQDTVPNGPQDFGFRGCAGPDGALGCGTFVLDDDTGSTSVLRSATYGGLTEGVEYAVVQDEVSGFGLTGISCTQGTVDVARRRAVVVLQPGQQVTCTFTTRTTSLTIVEDVTPTGPQAFTFTGCRGTGSAAACSSFVLDDTVSTATPSSTTATGLDVGVDYVVTQAQVPSHGLVDLSCTTGTVDLAAGRATVRLDAGEQATCTFTNRATSLAVVQDTRPNDTQAFSFTRCRQGADPATCATFVLDDSTSTGTPKTSTASGLDAGSYTVEQVLPAGYGYASSSSVSCDGADAVWDGQRLTVALTAGAQVTCTFVVDVTSLTVVLDNAPNDAQDMAFTICGPTPEECTDVLLDDDLTATPTPTLWSRAPAAAGEYTIEQAAVPRWKQSEITCTSGTTDVAAGRAQVTLSPGEQVSCVFENSLTQLVVVEDTTPQGVRSFQYSLCVEGGSCWGAVLDDSSSSATPSSYSLAGVQPGRVTITQGPEEGYGLTGLSCNNTGETIDLANGRAIVDLDLGEQVTCTFVNTRNSITLRHSTTPSSDPQDFGYTTCGPAWCDEVVLDTDSADPGRISESSHVEPPAGPYTMTMPTLPAGWAVTSLTCTAPATTDRVLRQVAFTLDPGERITCTYSVAQTALTVGMDLEPNGARDVGFTLCPTSGDPCTPFTLDDDGTTTPLADVRTFAGLEPGTYTVVQDPVDDWVITHVSCWPGEVVDPAARRATVELLPGERTTCTFTNVTPSLRLTHDTEPNASPSFVYDVCAAASASCWTLSLGDGSSPVFADIAPGVYTITQHPVAGWEIQAIMCQIGDDVDVATGQAVVRISVGEAAWCWFVNRPVP